MHAIPHNSESKKKKHARHNHRCFLAQVSSPNEGWNCLEGKILVPTNGDPGIDEYLAWKPPFFQETGGKLPVANARGLDTDSLGGGPVEKSCKADQSSENSSCLVSGV